MTPHELRALIHTVRAKRADLAVKGFSIHAIVFVCVMLGLLVVNIGTGDGWWVQWPLIGWGAGLAGHALAVFVVGRTVTSA
jgi:fatty acid desaturase